MEEKNLLVKHSEWANRTAVRTLGILVIGGIAMLFTLKDMPMARLAVGIASAIAIWMFAWICSRWPATKAYTRYVTSLTANCCSLGLLFLLGGNNAAVPNLFYGLIGLNLIFLDEWSVLFTGLTGLVFQVFFFFAHRDVMTLTYLPRTLNNILILYAIAIPGFFVAARRARNLLKELQEKEQEQEELNGSLVTILSRAAGVSVVLKDASSALSNHSGELQASAEEAAAGMEEMARMVDVQAGEVAHVTHSVAEINSLSESIVRRSEELTLAFQQTSDAAGKGAGLAQSTVASMSEMGATMSELSGAARKLKERSLQIADILTFVSGLTKQTNMLALNATIEASRAGEAGMGFSIVADEIRKVAEQSAQGARQIGEIVAKVLDEIEHVYEAVQRSSAIVVKGVENVGQVSDDFKQILQTIQQGSVRVRDVYSSMEELVAQNNAIMDAATSLASLSEETAAGSEEVAATVQRQAADIQTVADQARGLTTSSETLDALIRQYGGTKMKASGIRI